MLESYLGMMREIFDKRREVSREEANAAEVACQLMQDSVGNAQTVESTSSVAE